jgi:hypothetical protein
MHLSVAFITGSLLMPACKRECGFLMIKPTGRSPGRYIMAVCAGSFKLAAVFIDMTGSAFL